jgi:hypothetical protein
VAGRRAHRHRARQRLRVSGQAVQVAVGDRPGDHRHALERPVILRRSELFLELGLHNEQVCSDQLAFGVSTE